MIGVDKCEGTGKRKISLCFEKQSDKNISPLVVDKGRSSWIICLPPKLAPKFKWVISLRMNNPPSSF